MGKVRTVRNPVLFDRDGPDLRTSAPLLGADSADLLAEIGYSRDEIAALVKAGITRLAS